MGERNIHKGDQHPRPGTAEFAQLQDELTFSMAHIEAPTKRDLRQRLAAHILRFMVRRNCWPVGTRIEVTRNYQTVVTFPEAR